jgi:hypothetical protein
MEFVGQYAFFLTIICDIYYKLKEIYCHTRPLINSIFSSIFSIINPVFLVFLIWSVFICNRLFPE